MQKLDRELYNEFFRIGREGKQAMTEQEERDHRSNAKAIFNNPTFQLLFKQFHALEFTRLTEAIDKGYEAMRQHKYALDAISTIYEHFQNLNDDEEKDNSLTDDPYDGE